MKQSIEYLKKINNYGTDKEPYYFSYCLDEGQISFDWYKEILKKVLQLKDKPKRVIDIGSGFNMYGFLFANEGIEYIGIDEIKDNKPIETDKIKFIHRNYYDVREQFKDDVIISCLCVQYLIPIEDVLGKVLIVNDSTGTGKDFKCLAKQIKLKED